MSFETTAAFDWSAPLPRFRRVCLAFPRPRESDLFGAVQREFARCDAARHLGGKRVAVTAGSRGIAAISEILRAVARCIRDGGGEPFIVPAMGSHGGATVEGQVELLRELGVVEERVGAPIVASMDVVELGRLPGGMPVFLDRIAAQADAIIVVNRIKPHPDFTGDFESGLAKMTAIGLGKRHGADTIHRYGPEGLRDLIPQAARMIAQAAPLAFGLAILENAYHETARIQAVPVEGIAGPEEAALLREAYRLTPQLPFDEIDVLVVDEIGKDISGIGMDGKVVGRLKVHGWAEPVRPKIHIIAVLGVTPESHGNAVGIGLAEVTTRRLVEQIDFDKMYINSLTAGISGIQRAAVPIVAPDDRRAILTALRACGRPDIGAATVVRIKNTLMLDCLDVSENLVNGSAGASNFISISPAFDLSFDAQGQLLPFDQCL